MKQVKQQDNGPEAPVLGPAVAPSDPFSPVVRGSRMPMIFSDPRADDCPIFYANDAFCQLTGYQLDELIGRNCRLLQGPDTDRHTVSLIRAAIAKQAAIGVDILNYKKDGTSFWNALHISPVFGDNGDLLYFFASQFDATDRLQYAQSMLHRQAELEAEVGHRTRELRSTLAELKAALHEKTLLVHEIDHRVKNNLQTISTLISMQLRSCKTVDTREALSSLRDRVDALGAVHRRLTNHGTSGVFDLAELISDLVPEIVKGHSRGAIRVEFDLTSALLGSQFATPVSLIINEVTTNALQNAWAVEQAGVLKVTVENRDRQAVLTVADDGNGVRDSNARPGSGFKLTAALVRQMRGTLKWLPSDRGTTVEIGVPLR